MRPPAPAMARTHTRRLASMAGCVLASITAVAVAVPALLAAFSHVPVMPRQMTEFRPSAFISLSGMPAGTASWMVPRFFCTAEGANLFSVAL